MNKKSFCILIVTMMILSVFGAMSFPATKVKSSVKSKAGMDYSHTILAEYFTLTTCEPCKYAHQALKNIYKYHGKNLGYHPFYYITMVFDDPGGNKWAKQRKEELNIDATPNVAWDGGYRKNQGATSVHDCESRYNTSITRCGNRNVKDIDLELDVEWRGATNPDPSNSGTMVPVENNLSWTVTAMDINVSIENNENSQYNGHLHVYVTEVNSTYWGDKYDNPYTFAFLDYAWNKNVTLYAGSSWSDTDEWDGMDHHSGYGEIFDEIREDNCMVIAAIFDKDNDNYTDETVGVPTGKGTDPKQFDIYFGNTTPPPLVDNNNSYLKYDPTPGAGEILEFDTTYYWKVNVWNNKGEKTLGDIFSFTTRGNSPPNSPYNERPRNRSLNNPIDTNLTWVGGDPDMDDVTYDVYFGVHDPLNPPPLVANNISQAKYDPSPIQNNLEFETKYEWKIVAWDKYDYKTVGDSWVFTTEKNEPPNQASDPIPDDGASNIPIELEYLYWNGSDPNSGDKLRYDVYFDDVFPPTQKSWEQTEESWEIPYTLTLYNTYYWRIDTYDRDGLKTEGDNWNFTTGLNHPPYVVISGPSKGVPNKNYEFKFTVTDPDGHDVMLYVDWDDGDKGWIDGVYESGSTISLNHSWSERRLYTIEAKAKDQFNLGGESIYHEWLGPRGKSSIELWFLKFLERFPFLSRLIYFIL